MIGTQRAHRFSAWTAALLGVAVFAEACDRSRPGEEPRDEATAPRAAPPYGSQPTGEPALPAPGSALVWFSEGGVTAVANRAPRLGVLRGLGREAGFRLEISEGVALSGTVTLRIVDATLDEVLAQILEGISYALHYRFRAIDGERILSYVAVGEDEGEAVVEVADAREEPRELGRDERPRDEREIRERHAANQAEYFEQLESPDVAVRADAAEWIFADADTIPALSALLDSDPSPKVRAAAAETLGESNDSSEAVSTLLRALDDDDSQVVIAALDALEWVGDERIIPELGFLLDHPDAEVRERTIEAIEFLE